MCCNQIVVVHNKFEDPPGNSVSSGDFSKLWYTSYTAIRFCVSVDTIVEKWGK